jgi:hypothetical protein
MEKLKTVFFLVKKLIYSAHLRNGQDVIPLIQKSIQSKHKERAGLKDFADADFSFENRSMIRIGG